jgi:hypothetical protein
VPVIEVIKRQPKAVILTALARSVEQGPASVDRNSVAREVWVRLADCGVHPFLWSRQRRRDRPAA